MRVVCVRTGGYFLTIGKIYDVKVNIDAPVSTWTNRPVYDYIIINDIGKEHQVESSIFRPLSEVRSEKLEDLGI